MARSSKVDPVERFRFRVTVVAVDPSLTGVVETIASVAGNNTLKKTFAILSRSGFNEITLPKANVSEMPYRENIDNLRFSKIPGLVKYDPITLRRGVTINRDLYDWYRLINEEIALLSAAQELNQNAKFIPRQSENYRKDIVIEVLDRSGKAIKGWYLLNAWPVSYKPGNDLNASADEKLIEEMTLTYELFLELEGGIEGLAKELAKGVLIAGAGALLNEGLPFLRD